MAGYLPLAISLLARVYTKHRAWSMSELIEETRVRLLTLGAEQHTVAAAFDLSYQALSPARRRFFRLLGLHLGSDMDVYAAAALTGTDFAQARAHLDALHGDHLITEPSYGRYGMHDLIRVHARAHTEGSDPIEQREAALDRLLRYYAHTAQTASLPIARLPLPEPDEPAPAYAPKFTDRDAARAWLRVERPNLRAAFAHAHGQGLDEHTVMLAAGLAEIWFSDGPLNGALEVHRAATDAASRHSRPAVYAAALNRLGRVRYLTGNLPGATDTLAQALEVSRQAGNRLSEATALILIGRVRRVTGDYQGAVNAHEQALEIYHQIGNRLGEATALSDLGKVASATGDLRQAVEALAQALEIYRQISFPLGEADDLDMLGRIWSHGGDHQRAAQAHAQALEIYRQIGHSGNESHALNHYAAAIAATGNRAQALALYEQALAMNRELNKPDDEAAALEGIGEPSCYR